MSRFRSAKAYGFGVKKEGDGFIIWWTVDHHYSGSRLRHPRVTRRLTDRAGAERFVKRHKLNPSRLQ